MLTRLNSLKGELLNPLWWKLAVTALGYFFALINQFLPPSDLAPLPEDANPQDVATIKIGGFVIITAVALFAGLIPTGTKKPMEKLVDGTARLLGVLAAFGAGWHTLNIPTQGDPSLYMFGVASLTGLAIVALLIWAGIFAVFQFVLTRDLSLCTDTGLRRIGRCYPGHSNHCRMHPQVHCQQTAREAGILTIDARFYHKCTQRYNSQKNDGKTDRDVFGYGKPSLLFISPRRLPP